MLNKIFATRNIGKLFLALIVVTLLTYIRPLIFGLLKLPDNPTEADNLTQFQILTGFIINILGVIFSIFRIILVILFNISLLYNLGKWLFAKKASNLPRQH